MKAVQIFLLRIVPLFFYIGSYSQDVFDVIIKLPDIKHERLFVSYNDGQTDKHYKIGNTAQNVLHITDTFYSRYATIRFAYPDSTETDGIPTFSFWVSSIPATISFFKDSSNKKNPFENYKLMNAYAMGEMGEKNLKNFILHEQKDAKSFYLTYKDSISKSMRLQAIFKAKINAVVDKELEFIKQNVGSYYSLWLFYNEMAGSNNYPIDSLLSIYTNVFPDSLKQTYEGNEILKILQGRTMTKKGESAPEFQVKDIKGNTVSLNKLHGKYVLIDFWASWCAPCMRLSPTLNEIRKKYSKEKLEIISVSLDQDYNSFTKALNSSGANWTQIFRGNDLIKKFAIGPIPQCILVNKIGVVEYNMEEEKDNYLKKLSEILEIKLN